MPKPTLIVAGVVAVIMLAASPGHAQRATPYIPLDDPRLPLLELLIRRGDVDDPSPQVRPFRRGDAVRVLLAADTGGSALSPAARRLVQTLLRAYRDDVDAEPGEGRIEFELQAGAQSYSQGRRDLLQPGGPGSTEPWGQGTLRVRYGPFVGAARGVADARLFDDPDWTGNPLPDSLSIARFPEAYGSFQSGPVAVTLGTVHRNWGPVGQPGYALGDYRYPFGELGLSVAGRRFRFDASIQRLWSVERPDGLSVDRWMLAHRLGIAPSDRLSFGVWETVIAQGIGRGFDLLALNPFVPITFVNQWGVFQERTNIMFGADVRWRASRALLLEGQLALDDLTLSRGRCAGCPIPRFGFTVQASGPLGQTAAWRGSYTWTSSLFGQTFDALEFFADRGVGVGRPFVDQDRLSLTVSLPVVEAVTIEPEVAHQRQGERTLRTPFPARPEDFPVNLTGTVQRTLSAGGSVSGRLGAVELRAAGSAQRVSNFLNAPGDNRTRFVGELRASVGVGLSRPLR